MSVDFPGEIHKGGLMPDGGQDLLKQICCAETQAAGIETGMTAEKVFRKKIPIDK